MGTHLSRVRLKQKDFDSIKRKMEEVIIDEGGTFKDYPATSKKGGGIKSFYTVGDITIQYKWHQTYSSGSTKMVVTVLRGILKKLGLGGLIRRVYSRGRNPRTPEQVEKDRQRDQLENQERQEWIKKHQILVDFRSYPGRS